MFLSLIYVLVDQSLNGTVVCLKYILVLKFSVFVQGSNALSQIKLGTLV